MALQRLSLDEALLSTEFADNPTDFMEYIVLNSDKSSTCFTVQAMEYLLSKLSTWVESFS